MGSRTWGASPQPDGRSGVLETTWWGGNNNAQVDTRGRILAVIPETSCFHHPARVWREADGTFAGEWLDDSVKDRPQDWKWKRFSEGSRIPGALYEQAEQEQAAREGIAAAGACDEASAGQHCTCGAPLDAAALLFGDGACSACGVRAAGERARRTATADHDASGA